MKKTKILLISLILLTTIIVVITIVFTKRPKEIIYKYDDSMFININIKQAISLFSDKEPKLLFIGRQNCEGCYYQGPALQLALAEYHFDVYHLDIETAEYTSDEINEFANLLTFQYELYDKTGPFGLFLGYTPMIIIIKDGKQVFGHVGYLKKDDIHTLVKQYGVI